MKHLIAYIFFGSLLAIIMPIMVPFISFWETATVLVLFLVISWFRSQPHIKILGTAAVAVVALTAIFYFAKYQIVTHLPMCRQSLPWVTSLFDEKAAKLVDSVSIKVDMTWDVYRAKYSQELMDTVNARLERKDTKGAALAQQEFNRLWDKEQVENGIQDSAAAASRSVLAVAQPQPIIPNPVKPSPLSVVLDPGEHQYALQAGQETPVISMPNCGKFVCDISSPMYKYKILYSDSTQYDGGPNTVIPDKKDVSFRVKALSTDQVTIKVTKIG